MVAFLMSRFTKDVAIRFAGFASLVLSIVFQMEWMILEQQAYPSPSYSVHTSYLYPAYVLQLILQSWWLIEYTTISSSEENPGHVAPKDRDEEQRPLPGESKTTKTPSVCQLYMPILVLSNICMVAWTIACTVQLYALGLAFLAFSACVQLSGIFGALQVIKQSYQERSRSTVVLAKVNAAYTIMYLWKTWGMMETLASGPDPTFGLFLIYVLAALYNGPSMSLAWHDTFFWTAAVLSALVVIDPIVFLVHDCYAVEEEDIEVAGEHMVDIFTSDMKEHAGPEDIPGSLPL
ncbi:hypothetical protein WG66_016045 [Moniliophthora roreri]|nr:hypothetical protein WG66_016045 [Moniliophthora roreri]